jgi:hypothetical protein
MNELSLLIIASIFFVGCMCFSLAVGSQESQFPCGYELPRKHITLAVEGRQGMSITLAVEGRQGMYITWRLMTGKEIYLLSLFTWRLEYFFGA